MPTLFIYTLWRCMICFFSLIYCQSHTFLIDCQFQVGGPWDHDGRCMTTIISELFLLTRKEDQRGRERRPSQRHFRVRSGVVFQVRLRPFFFFLSFSCCVVLCPVKEHHFTLYNLCSSRNNTQASFTSRNIFTSGWYTQYWAVVVQLLHLNRPIISPFFVLHGKKNPDLHHHIYKILKDGFVLFSPGRPASLCLFTLLDDRQSHLPPACLCTEVWDRNQGCN